MFTIKKGIIVNSAEINQPQLLSHSYFDLTSNYCNHNPFRWKHIKPQKTYRLSHTFKSSQISSNIAVASQEKEQYELQLHIDSNELRRASNCRPRSQVWRNRPSRLTYGNTFKRRDGPTAGDCIGYRPPKEKLGLHYSDSWLSAKRTHIHSKNMGIQTQYHRRSNRSTTKTRTIQIRKKNRR